MRNLKEGAEENFSVKRRYFGFEGIEADFEIISLMADLMKAFNAREGMFEIRINNRKLMDDFYKTLDLNESQKKIVNKAVDKRQKYQNKNLRSGLKMRQNWTKNNWRN